ncbi:steroid C27-monooxygenase domain protein [Mycobacterium kansasii]|uniref:Steroid C27-monooxygenase domain protein n=1 Tax=Mycobacterium kansasii TaxID=1768 RepID=A0A1V3X234_MYCKA|nr:steroid C27-monooxygenase domain protein [Mycobacterium kansasii]
MSTAKSAAESTAKPAPNLPPGFDFTDPDIYAERLPVAELAEMRRCAPIWWNEQPIGCGGFDDGGYWVVTKHKDVKEISRRSDVFSSLQKTALPRYKDGTVAEQIDRGKFVLLNMDDPQHTRLRKIISRGFTPGPSSGCATTSTSAPGASSRPRRRGVPATLSSRCPANCRCRPSPGCSVCPRKTA